MPSYIALLRGINVGGTGLLPMKDLVALCNGLGHTDVRTYIQSGNVILQSPLTEAKIRAALEKSLREHMGKPIEVMVRTAAEMRAILVANPFAEQDPARVYVHFLNSAPTRDVIQKLVAPGGEQIRLGIRELYIYYPNGMGQTKLKLTPIGAPATARNMNTVAKLVALSTD